MKNKDRLVEIIKNDCNITSFYFRNGETCAIGALALDCGISPETLELGMSRYIDHPAMAPVAKAIEDRFGLTIAQQNQIQAANDGGWSPEARRAAILDYLDTLI